MSTVPEAALVAVLVRVVVVAAATRRRQRGLRNSAAATTDLTVDDRSVTRTLGDGRVESARWSALESVELVRTPVKTADGASSFLILAETAQLGLIGARIRGDGRGEEVDRRQRVVVRDDGRGDEVGVVLRCRGRRDGRLLPLPPHLVEQPGRLRLLDLDHLVGDPHHRLLGGGLGLRARAVAAHASSGAVM